MKIGMIAVLVGGLAYFIVPPGWYLFSLKPPGFLFAVSVLVHMVTLQLAPRLPALVIFLLISTSMFVFIACLPRV